MKKKRITLKWGNKEDDWKFEWPDNNGKSLMGVFFDMIKTTGHRVDWQENLAKMLHERGYDYKTLKLTVDRYDENSKEKEKFVDNKLPF